MEYIITNCPHCEIKFQIYITEFNCRIFRCGVYISNLHQIPPHLDKTSCELLVKNNHIYGCGKPFMISPDNHCIICDYI